MNAGEEDMASTHIDASGNIASEYTRQGSPGELPTVTGEFSACPSSTGRLQQLSRVGLFATLWAEESEEVDDTNHKNFPGKETYV